MVSNQILADMLQNIRKASGVDFRLYTLDGLCIHAEGVKRSDDLREVMKLLNSETEVLDFGECSYFPARDGNRMEYVVCCPQSENAHLLGRMAVVQTEALITAYQERFDRDNFIKNLLLDNLLLVDIYSRAKKLHIDIHKRRVAYLIETKAKDDVNALETIRTMYADSEADFVAAIDENNIILVRELSDSDTDEDMMMTANTLVDMLNTEAMSEVRVAFGNVADEIRKVSNSYKEAKLALSIGKIFNTEQNVTSYAALGIGRLIYQLPLPMCKMFIDEIFKGQTPEQFDEETLSTINQFFANNLNVSETSRKLYIHRNTLVYRLDKLQKNTGLDLRVFDDAITFKIALMVVKYMHYMENQE